MHARAAKRFSHHLLDLAFAEVRIVTERTFVRIDNTLREEFSNVDEVFLEPAPRNDPQLRARVRARYGEADLRALAPE